MTKTLDNELMTVAQDLEVLSKDVLQMERTYAEDFPHDVTDATYAFLVDLQDQIDQLVQKIEQVRR